MTVEQLTRINGLVARHTRLKELAKIKKSNQAQRAEMYLLREQLKEEDIAL